VLKSNLFYATLLSVLKLISLISRAYKK